MAGVMGSNARRVVGVELPWPMAAVLGGRRSKRREWGRQGGAVD